MNASVYQGESRAIPRWVVTGLGIGACGRLGAMLLFDLPGPRTHREAPWLLRLPFEVRPVAFILALLAAMALVQFGRRRRQLAWGAVAMACLAYLSESQSVLTGSGEHDLFICGALLLGWLFGVFFARGLDRQLSRPGDLDRDDELGEAGARGTFVAVYLGACASKLLDGGTQWLDGRSLLVHILGQHTFTGGVLDRSLDVVMHHPRIASTLAAVTLLIQASAIVSLFGPRLQTLWSTLIIGFHLNAFLLMGVKYFNPMIAALALAYPWPRILRKLRGRRSMHATVVSPASEVQVAALGLIAKQATAWIVLAWAAAVICWLGIHLNDSATLFTESPR